MRSRKARAIMVQGTTSSAGKSTVVSGLCRLLHRNGYRVAPFKPQNMALNSAVTEDGGEIGRSQAVQAMACAVACHSDMNPILLKPHSDQGAQVIVQGRPIGNFSAGEYHGYKELAMPHVLESWERLRQQYDVIVVEGAGSPAEVNLRENDVANMGFALEADCPVVLVADIDRGGVFAHLVGTMACLAPAERDLVRGFLINRFRGDRRLLEPGNDWLCGQTGKPVLGVLPWLGGLYLPSEDSVEEASETEAGTQALRINVPRLPRMSNHTDFDPLRLHPLVDIRFVGPGDAIPPADLVILPGSKSTVADLGWLKDNGWVDYLLRHLRYGGKLMGICGGLQMLGTAIHDPSGVEGPPGSAPGLGLLALETTLRTGKQLRNVTGAMLPGGERISGYEIHMGETTGLDRYAPLLALDDGRRDGALSDDRRILCTYLHGIFDTPEALESLLKWVRQDGATIRGGDDRPADPRVLLEREFDRLADAIEAELPLGWWLELMR